MSHNRCGGSFIDKWTCLARSAAGCSSYVLVAPSAIPQPSHTPPSLPPSLPHSILSCALTLLPPCLPCSYLELETAEFMMATVMNSVVSQGMISSSKKGLQLFCDTPAEFKAMNVFGDQVRHNAGVGWHVVDLVEGRTQCLHHWPCVCSSEGESYWISSVLSHVVLELCILDTVLISLPHTSFLALLRLLPPQCPPLPRCECSRCSRTSSSTPSSSPRPRAGWRSRWSPRQGSSPAASLS